MSPQFWRLASTAGFGLLLAGLLNGCLLGGTGTGTGNGLEETPAETPEMGLRIRYTDSLAQPVSGLVLQIWPADYSPLDPAPLGFLKSIGADSSRSGGRATLIPGRHWVHFAAPGAYVVTAILGDAVVALDTIRVAPKQPFDSVEFAIGAVKSWSGRIALESKMKIDSGWLVVHGTSFKAKVDSSGFYQLGKMPVGLRQMVRLSLESYRNHPVAVLQATRVKSGTPIHTTDTSKININDTTKTTSDTASGTRSSFPNGAMPPDTIQVLSSGLSSLEQAPNVIQVKCVSDSLGESVCLDSVAIPYSTVSTNDAMAPTPKSADSLNVDLPVYTETGKMLPGCSSAANSKSSDDLIANPSAGDSDFIVLDVSASPTCDP